LGWHEGRALIGDILSATVAILDAIVLWRVYGSIGVSLLASTIVWLTMPESRDKPLFVGALVLGLAVGCTWHAVVSRASKRRGLG
jgi:hypothetical protein